MYNKLLKKSKPRLIEYRSHKNFNANDFNNNDLRNVPWHVIGNESDMDDALSTWNNLFSEVADDHAPIRKRRIKGTPFPWMNNNIRDLIQKRDYFHRKARKTNTSKHWNSYRTLRNTVNHLVKSAKSKYYCDKINDAKGDSKKIWVAVNEACQ